MVTNKAEIEYAVMLAVLNFQTEFMKCAYSNVQAHVVDELIHVRLVRTVPIPAEQELERSSEGHELLRRYHGALFDSCRHILKDRIEQAIGMTIHSILTDIDPVAGKNTIVIRLHEPVAASTSCPSVG
ncbi:MAG: Na-translocating system protein MpsC family protein [Nitrospira sp.]